MKVELRIQAPMGHELRWLGRCQNVSIAAPEPVEAARLARIYAERLILVNVDRGYLTHEQAMELLNG